MEETREAKGFRSHTRKAREIRKAGALPRSRGCARKYRREGALAHCAFPRENVTWSVRRVGRCGACKESFAPGTGGAFNETRGLGQGFARFLVWFRGEARGGRKVWLWALEILPACLRLVAVVAVCLDACRGQKRAFPATLLVAGARLQARGPRQSREGLPFIARLSARNSPETSSRDEPRCKPEPPRPRMGRPPGPSAVVCAGPGKRRSSTFSFRPGGASSSLARLALIREGRAIRPVRGGPDL